MHTNVDGKNTRALLTFFSHVIHLDLIINFDRRACFHLDKFLQQMVKERENRKQSKTRNGMAAKYVMHHEVEL